MTKLVSFLGPFRRWQYLFVYCVVLIPLFWNLGAEHLWSDEFYSVYYSKHIWRALFEETHLPFIFFVNRIFVELLGINSPYLGLNSLLPVCIGLWMFLKLSKNWGGSSLFFCVTLVFVLNPVFLQFSRSIRSNAYVYVSIILTLFLMVNFEGKRKHLYLFLTSLIGGVLFLYASITSMLVVFLYSIITRKKDWRSLQMTTAGLVVVLVFFCIKKFGLNFNASFYSLTPDLNNFKRMFLYFFTYAEETFSFNWDQSISGMVGETYFRFYIILMSNFLFISFIGSYFKNKSIFRIQIILLVMSISSFLVLWMLALVGVPLLTYRNHLGFFSLILIAMGLGFFSIYRFWWGKFVISLFTVLSVWHLGNINFYKTQPLEIEAITWAKQYQNENVIFGCLYRQKYELLGLKNVVSDCREERIGPSIKGNQIIVLEDFFNPGSDLVKEKLQSRGYKEMKVKNFHYSKVYLFIKD